MVVGALISCAFFFAYTAVRSHAANLGFTCSIYFFVNVYYGTLYAYTPEVLPSAHRATGNGIAIACNRVMGLVSAAVATSANTATSAPIYICAVLYIIMVSFDREIDGCESENADFVIRLSLRRLCRSNHSGSHLCKRAIFCCWMGRDQSPCEGKMLQRLDRNIRNGSMLFGLKIRTAHSLGGRIARRTIPSRSHEIFTIGLEAATIVINLCPDTHSTCFLLILFHSVRSYHSMSACIFHPLNSGQAGLMRMVGIVPLVLRTSRYDCFDLQISSEHGIC
jgi:hypothetical protein